MTIFMGGQQLPPCPPIPPPMKLNIMYCDAHVNLEHYIHTLTVKKVNSRLIGSSRRTRDWSFLSPI